MVYATHMMCSTEHDSVLCGQQMQSLWIQTLINPRPNSKDEGSNSQPKPWLLKPTDDIGEFVLRLASASTSEENGSRMMQKNAVGQYSLYLSSATSGNIFAMASLDQMYVVNLLLKNDLCP